MLFCSLRAFPHSTQAPRWWPWFMRSLPDPVPAHFFALLAVPPSMLAGCFLQIGIAALPEAPPAKPADDVSFLKSVHDLVMDIHVMEGALVCPHCGRSYPVSKGIPNMLLKEDEL